MLLQLVFGVVQVKFQTTILTGQAKMKKYVEPWLMNDTMNKSH